MIRALVIFRFIPFCKKISFYRDSFLLYPELKFVLAIVFMLVFIISRMKFCYTSKKEKIYHLTIRLGLLVLSALAMITGSFFIFIVTMEIRAFPAALLIMFQAKEFEKLYSTLIMLAFNLIARIPFITLINENRLTGAVINHWMCSLTEFISNWFESFKFLLLLIFKIPVIIAHYWLPKAHVRASGVISIILAGSLIKIASMGLINLGPVFRKSFYYIIRLRLRMSLFSLLWFTLTIIRSVDIKVLIAFSSLVHMRLTFPCASRLVGRGCKSALFISVSHGVISASLFYFVTLIYEKTLNRRFFFSKFLESTRKPQAMIFIMILIANLGIPPFINFLREILGILTVVYLTKISFFFLFIYLASTALYFLRINPVLISGKKLEPKENSISLKIFSKIFCFFFLFLVLPIF